MERAFDYVKLPKLREIDGRTPEEDANFLAKADALAKELESIE